MARLKAHGTELLRISREREFAPVACPNEFAENGYSPSSIYWEKITRAYFSDGKILEKRQVKFTPSSINTFDPISGVHDWGWKISARMKKGCSVHERARKTFEWTKNQSAWIVESVNEFALFHSTNN